MFQALRNRLSYANVAATLALIFAITSGAFAASGGGSSPSHATLTASAAKAKAKVKTGPRGPAGKNGAPGAIGPAGPAGPVGPAGPTGPAGAGAQGPAGNAGEPGKAGESVTIAPAGAKCLEGGTKFSNATGEGAACNGEPGAKGEAGKEGSPWTAGGTLPSGKTETGVWFAHFTGGLEGAKGTEENVQSAISFTIPLKAPLDASHVHYANTLIIQEKFGGGAGELCAGLTGAALSTCETNGKAIRTACPGSAAEPTAGAGQLCLYEGQTTATNTIAMNMVKPTSIVPGAGTAGAIANANDPGVEEESADIVGAWAVTAP